MDRRLPQIARLSRLAQLRRLAQLPPPSQLRRLARLRLAPVARLSVRMGTKASATLSVLASRLRSHRHMEALKKNI